MNLLLIGLHVLWFAYLLGIFALLARPFNRYTETKHQRKQDQ